MSIAAPAAFVVAEPPPGFQVATIPALGKFRDIVDYVVAHQPPLRHHGYPERFGIHAVARDTGRSVTGNIVLATVPTVEQALAFAHEAAGYVTTPVWEFVDGAMVRTGTAWIAPDEDVA